MDDWHKKVYRLPKGKRFGTKRWSSIRKKVLERDYYVCQMCRKSYFDEKLTLQAHHIKSRRKGGKDTLSNLITLCMKCHDTAEMEGFTKNDILDYNPDFTIPKKPVERADWHKWVYGGYRRPGT